MKSGPVTECQACGSRDLEQVLHLGFHALCNDMRPIDEPSRPFATYPLELLRCPKCTLVQLGYIVPSEELFPASYPYSSSTTRILRENFADLRNELDLFLGEKDLIVDIGGNDGNLLSNFTDTCRTLNVTPEDMGKAGEERGIPHLQDYWGKDAAKQVVAKHGKAKVVTATNVFAHVPDVHEFLEAVLDALTPDGLFVVEAHYLGALIDGVQYDAIYSEHMRFLSVESLKWQCAQHGLELVSGKRIPTHAGSIRCTFARKKTGRKACEFGDNWATDLATFAQKVPDTKAAFWHLITNKNDEYDHALRLFEEPDFDSSSRPRLVGIGAPSRASTLISYLGLDVSEVQYVCEISGSHKIGKFMPGTRIPVVDEARLYEEQPDFAVLFSWHIADQLIHVLRANGYKGSFIKPLPFPEIVE
jgi:hypothetical protein